MTPMTATPAEVANTKGKGKPTAAKAAKAEAETEAPQQPPKSLKLPADLRGYHDELLKAVNTPFPKVWDDEVTYVDAAQPAAIAKVLIRVLHYALTNAKVAYVFRKTIKRGDTPRLVQSSKIGGKLNYFSGLNLLIEVNWDKWQNLSAERRLTVIDHALTHFTRGETSYEMVTPDIEEFGVVVRRWGLWHADVERFASSIDRARQLDIFTAPIDKAATTTKALN